MGNKFGLLLLLLLIYLTSEILLMISITCLLSNGRIFFAVIAMYGVHYYATKTTETFKRLI